MVRLTNVRMKTARKKVQYLVSEGPRLTLMRDYVEILKQSSLAISKTSTFADSHGFVFFDLSVLRGDCWHHT